MDIGGGSFVGSRIFHIAFDKALRSVAWDKHGENEYVLVGNGVTFDCDRLQSLIDFKFTKPVVWLSPSRHEAIAILRANAAAQIIKQLSSAQQLNVSDDNLHMFLNVHSMGVARTGSAQADYSIKPKPAPHLP